VFAADAVHSLIELGPIELVDELGGAEGGGGAMPRCSSAVVISNTRHSIAFFIFITPALTACWFASAVVLASTSARAASTKERIPGEFGFRFVEFFPENSGGFVRLRCGCGGRLGARAGVEFLRLPPLELLVDLNLFHERGFRRLLRLGGGHGEKFVFGSNVVYLSSTKHASF